jgi:hypothetical protein
MARSAERTNTKIRMTSILTAPRALLTVGVAVAALAAGGDAFTASNTVPDSNAGYGGSTVSGYTISSVSYHLAADPTTSDYVTFDVSPDNAGIAPTVVKAKPGAADTVYTDCANTAGSTWKCTWGSPITVATIDQLQIVATQ